MHKIYISTSSFNSDGNEEYTKLVESGVEIQCNSHGRKMTADEILESALDSDALVAGTEDLSKLVAHSGKLKIICRVGIGLDSVPLSHCREKQIRVCYTPGPVISSVAELAMALILAAARQVVCESSSIKQGAWPRSMGRQIRNSITGIIGFGRIGSKVAELISAFGPGEILVYDAGDITGYINRYQANGYPIRAVGLDELLASSDMMTIHVPFNARTRNMISRAQLELMKEAAILVNTSRGGVIDEQALYESLKNNRIAAAALDVFESEPYEGPLKELDNIILTSHIGSYSSSCRAEMERQALADVAGFFRNEPLLYEVPESEYVNQNI